MHLEIINAIESLKNSHEKTLCEYLSNNFGNKKIVLYGAGGFGKEIAQVLLDHNIKPMAFLDMKAKGTLLDVPIVNPCIFQDKDVKIVLSIVLNKKIRNEIIDFLHNLKFYDIIDAQEIRAMYIQVENGHTYENFKSLQNLILKPLDYLYDQESKKIYTKNIIAHITRDYKLAEETDEQVQYFVKTIPFQKGYQYFVDCGAYIGDTFLELLKLNKTKEYIGFEPIEESYKRLSENIRCKNIKAIAFPTAVSNKTQMTTFDNKLGSSNISSIGSIQVMSVKLDDILHNHEPTFIKMDIEGEEINALNGAKSLIHSIKPELAICIYHYINHFWEIPNLINEWNLEYDLYIRTHSSCCMETVLYAVRKEKN